MRVLVTGGNRYIGLALVGELARRGHDVTVANSHEVDLPEGVRRIHVDRRVPGALREALVPHRDGFDAIFDNTAYVLDDIEPMIELFSGRLRHYVFTSSTAVYRRSFAQPVTEGSRRHDPADEDPRKAYGVGKVRCEDHLLGLHANLGALRAIGRHRVAARVFKLRALAGRAGLVGHQCRAVPAGHGRQAPAGPGSPAAGGALP